MGWWWVGPRQYFFKNIFEQWAQLYDLVTDTKMKMRGPMNSATRERAAKYRNMLVIRSAEDSFLKPALIL